MDLELLNSRMKDFFDLHWLSQHMSFERATLTRAVHATFERRGTKLPTETPLALTAAFARDQTKNNQWKAFLRKGTLDAPSFPEIVTRLERFLLPLLTSKAGETTWDPQHGWRSASTSK